MKTTLLIMAAGIGSRFGRGIKQLEPIGLHDEIIMEKKHLNSYIAGYWKNMKTVRFLWQGLF